MPHLREPKEPPPIRVKEVERPVIPFLRPLEWISVVLRAFRVKPLPASYLTEVRPTFDLFGNHRIDQVKFEEVLGTLGDTEVVSSKVPGTQYRYYLSFAFMHNDAAAPTHVMQATRIISDGGAFPIAPMADPVRDGAAPANQFFAVRNVTVPPDARIGAQVEAIAAGSRITLRSIFLEIPIGEPHGEIT